MISWLQRRKHDTFLDLVGAHFSARTTAAQERRLWRHLPGCAACRERYRQFSLMEMQAVGEPSSSELAQVRLARGIFGAIFTRFWA